MSTAPTVVNTATEATVNALAPKAKRPRVKKTDAEKAAAAAAKQAKLAAKSTPATDVTKAGAKDSRKSKKDNAADVPVVDGAVPSPVVEKKKRRKTKKYDFKRPRTAYIFFSSLNRNKYIVPGEKVVLTETSRKSGADWANMSDVEKAPYFEMAKKDKAEYDAKKAALPVKPKRQCSAFIFYSNEKRPEIRKEYPLFTMEEIARKLGESWKNSTDDAKKSFVDKAKLDKERYDRELKEFNAKYPNVVSTK